MRTSWSFVLLNDPMRGQFLSQDPMFLGDPRQQNLRDPQSLNSYTYANGNPINKSDPQGLFVPEAIIGAGIGGVVGVGIQGATDLMTLRYSGFEAYVGAFAGGATFGAITGATDGLALPYLIGTGAVSGAVQSGTTQGLSLVDGSQRRFNSQDLVTSMGVNAVGAVIPGLRIKGVTIGNNSFSSIESQIYTKISRNLISSSNITPTTYWKMTTSVAAKQAPGALFTSFASYGLSTAQNNAVQNVISVALSSAGVNISQVMSALSGFVQASVNRK